LIANSDFESPLLTCPPGSHPFVTGGDYFDNGCVPDWSNNKNVVTTADLLWPDFSRPGCNVELDNLEYIKSTMAGLCYGISSSHDEDIFALTAGDLGFTDIFYQVSFDLGAICTQLSCNSNISNVFTAGNLEVHSTDSSGNELQLIEAVPITNTFNLSATPNNILMPHQTPLLKLSETAYGINFHSQTDNVAPPFNGQTVFCYAFIDNVEVRGIIDPEFYLLNSQFIGNNEYTFSILPQAGATIEQGSYTNTFESHFWTVDGNAIGNNTNETYNHIFSGGGTYDVCVDVTDSRGYCGTFCEEINVGCDANYSLIGNTTVQDLLDQMNPNDYIIAPPFTITNVAGTVFVDGVFTIDTELTTDFDFVSSEGSEIIVPQDGYLVNWGGSFTACGDSWQGITVEDGAYFAMKNIIQNNDQVIADAIRAVNLESGAELCHWWTIFEDNDTGIYLEGDAIMDDVIDPVFENCGDAIDIQHSDITHQIGFNGDNNNPPITYTFNDCDIGIRLKHTSAYIENNVFNECEIAMKLAAVSYTEINNNDIGYSLHGIFVSGGSVYNCLSNRIGRVDDYGEYGVWDDNNMQGTINNNQILSEYIGISLRGGTDTDVLNK